MRLVSGYYLSIAKGAAMIQDEKDIERAKLKLRLKKKHSSNKHLIESLAVYDAMLKYEKQSYYKLEAEYNRLNRKFESNFNSIFSTPVTCNEINWNQCCFPENIE